MAAVRRRARLVHRPGPGGATLRRDPQRLAPRHGLRVGRSGAVPARLPRGPEQRRVAPRRTAPTTDTGAAARVLT